MAQELVNQAVKLPARELRLLQPGESAELPDEGGVEWAPIAPYWSVLWRSGVVLARELDAIGLAGRRVVELGCGLAVPSIAAALAGAEVLATDVCEEALALAERNARANGANLATLRVDFQAPEQLVDRGPFDLVLAADVLYETEAVTALLSLLPRLAPETWLADPGRAPAEALLEGARERFEIDTQARGVVRVHRLRLRARAHVRDHPSRVRV